MCQRPSGPGTNLVCSGDWHPLLLRWSRSYAYTQDYPSPKASRGLLDLDLPEGVYCIRFLAVAKNH